MTANDPKLDHYPKTVSIKAGKKVVIRPMAAGDEARVKAFFTSLPHADTLFLRHDVTKDETFRRWFADLDYSKRLPLMALDGDSVVGHALLDATLPSWSPHVAAIRVVVADDYKMLAVGSVLAREIFDVASARGFEKVVAEMMDHQVAARRMFERMGFRAEAELKDHVKDLDGTKHHLVIMTCRVDDVWAKMEELLQDFSPWMGWH